MSASPWNIRCALIPSIAMDGPTAVVAISDAATKEPVLQWRCPSRAMAMMTIAAFGLWHCLSGRDDFFLKLLAQHESLGMPPDIFKQMIRDVDLGAQLRAQFQLATEAVVLAQSETHAIPESCQECGAVVAVVPVDADLRQAGERLHNARQIVATALNHLREREDDGNSETEALLCQIAEALG